jgi:hypothetical protein
VGRDKGVVGPESGQGGLGHERLRRLLVHFGTVQAVLKASDWGCAIGKGGPWRRPGSAEFEIGPRCNGNGLAPKVVVAWSPVMRVIPSYSGRFHHPLPIFFVLGPDDLVGPTVAIVGPRKASGYGLQKRVS